MTTATADHTDVQTRSSHKPAAGLVANQSRVHTARQRLRSGYYDSDAALELTLERLVADLMQNPG